MSTCSTYCQQHFIFTNISSNKNFCSTNAGNALVQAENSYTHIYNGTHEHIREQLLLLQLAFIAPIEVELLGSVVNNSYKRVLWRLLRKFGLSVMPNKIQFICWKVSAEINSTNAMKHQLFQVNDYAWVELLWVCLCFWCFYICCCSKSLLFCGVTTWYTMRKIGLKIGTAYSCHMLLFADYLERNEIFFLLI